MSLSEKASARLTSKEVGRQVHKECDLNQGEGFCEASEDAM